MLIYAKENNKSTVEYFYFHIYFNYARAFILRALLEKQKIHRQDRPESPGMTIWRSDLPEIREMKTTTCPIPPVAGCHVLAVTKTRLMSVRTLPHLKPPRFFYFGSKSIRIGAGIRYAPHTVRKW